MAKTKKQRQELDWQIPKCRCGNNLSLDRQHNGITNCPACDPKEPKEYPSVCGGVVTEVRQGLWCCSDCVHGKTDETYG